MTRQKQGDTRNFMEILEAELRKEIREEIRQEVLRELGLGSEEDVRTQTTPHPTTEPSPSAAVSARERLELWLSTTFAAPKSAPPRRPYRMRPNTSSTQPSESPQQTETEATIRLRRHHDLDAQDIAALEFFRRHGSVLTHDFSEDELKSAFRRLALKFHPDRHASASDAERKEFGALFQDTLTQTRRLERHFDSPRPAAA